MNNALDSVIVKLLRILRYLSKRKRVAFAIRHGLIDPTSACRRPLIEIGHTPGRKKAGGQGYPSV
jgi:hypothetical protein